MQYKYSVTCKDGIFLVHVDLHAVATDGTEWQKLSAAIANTDRILPKTGLTHYCMKEGGRGAAFEWWTEDTPRHDVVQSVAELAQLALSLAIDETLRVRSMIEVLHDLGGDYWKVKS